MQIKLKPMSVEACEMISRGLSHLPIKDCVGLWLDIKTQAEQQLAEASKPTRGAELKAHRYADSAECIADEVRLRETAGAAA